MTSSSSQIFDVMGDATQWKRFHQSVKIGFDYYRFVGFDYDSFVLGQRVTEGEEAVRIRNLDYDFRPPPR